jgi:branched-chain amino acid transport system substrate-binding protein
VNRVWAQAAQKKPLVIGLTMDASGQYGASGTDERLGAMLAIREFNEKGGVLGRRIEALHMDTETTPATGSRVAERLITRNEAAFLIGAVHSGVANAISQVAQKYGTVFFNTNSSSPTESGRDCHRVKFVWDGNGTNFNHAIVKNAMRVNGKNWLLLTNDYVWGHNTSKSTRSLVEANGGKVVEELMVPQNTRDFSSFLLKIQQIRPNVIAAAVGGDDIKALRQQVVQTKLDRAYAWINNQQDWPDVYGLGPDAVFGVFGTTWYYRLDLPGVKEFVAKYQKTYPGVQIKVPGNVFLNGYLATRELLRVVEEAGSTNNLAVIRKLEGRRMSALDRMQHHDAWIDPVTHQVQQTIYMASYNDRPAEKDDIFKILANVPPQEAVDQDAPKACKLESYESTPSYEA